MNRTHLLATAAGSLTLAALAGAQVTVVGEATSTHVNGGGGSIELYTFHTATGDSSSSGLALGLTTDWSRKLPRRNVDDSITIDAYMPFEVGPLPVRVRNYWFTANAKWVNGGGNSTQPSTLIDFRGYCAEQLGDEPDSTYDPLIFNDSGYRDMTGNGLTIVDYVSPRHQSGFILSPGVRYYLAISDRTIWRVTDFQPSMPTVSITEEGGAMYSDYDGFGVYMTYEVVPAPGAAALAACGLALGLSRRRR